ncbi:MAG: exodeoxyribonuclease VII large subunit [Clostridia bacterium]
MENNSVNYINVTQLNSYICNIFKAEELLHDICVVGEVSGLRVSGKHSYFVLKDENAQVQCNCFNYQKTYAPKENECIIVKGYVDYYVKGGKLSFNVSSVTPLGVGLLAVEFERLKAKLQEEGYFAEEHKKFIPSFLKKVCVITAKTGAVIKDIISTVRKKNNFLEIAVFDTQVQGVNAEKSIVEAVEFVDTLGFDAIVIARGGGAVEDLKPFNSEKLVKVIYNAVTPIISAVGHETDFTLCDFVADIRVPTPTAAGELIAFDAEAFKYSVNKDLQKLASAINFKMQNVEDNIKSANNIMLMALKMKFEVIKHNTITIATSLQNLMQQKVTNKENLLKQLIIKLDENNPTKLLAQGYFRVERDKKSILRVSELKINDKIELTGIDGTAIAEVKTIL